MRIAVLLIAIGFVCFGERMNLIQLLFEARTQPVGQYRIRRFRIHYHLHYVVLNQSFGQVLIEPSSHRKNINAVDP